MIQYIILCVITVLSGLQRIIFYNVGYDTDRFLLNAEISMQEWISSGRYVMSYFTKYLCLSMLDLRVLNAICCLLVFVYTILFIRFLKLDNDCKSGGDSEQTQALRAWGRFDLFMDRRKELVLAIVFSTTPLFMEQYYFTLQCVQVAFATILMMLAFYTTYFFLRDKRWWYGLLTVLLVALCIGFYQAFANVYIVGVLICLYKLNEEDTKQNLARIAGSIICLGVALLLYYVGLKLAQRATGFYDNGYLANGWLTLPFGEACFTVAASIGEVMLGYGHVLNLAFTICAIYVLLHMIREKTILSWKNFFLLALCISPFLMTIITCNMLAIRSAIAIPVFCTFVFCEYYEKAPHIKKVLVLVILSQVINGQLLMYADNVRFRNDLEISKKVYEDCNGNENTCIVFCGIERIEENAFSFKGQMMGKSYFQWDNKTGRVANERVHAFMKVNGYDYICPEQNLVDEGYKLDFTAEYPEDGYIQYKDGIYYVNLGQ